MMPPRRFCVAAAPFALAVSVMSCARRGAAARGTLSISTGGLVPRRAREGTSHAAADSGQEPVDLLVIAPHPDDEVLLAAGLIERRVVRGARVAVVVMTNGDFTCVRDGFAREDETVRALAELGVGESDVHFLGYPDGHLAELSTAPLPPLSRRDADGRCGEGNTTYARRGQGGVDEHTRRTGAPALYTVSNLVGDLAAIFARLRPREIVVPHPLDAHPDHAMTYAYVRRAFDALPFAPQRVLRGIVHAGACWPDIPSSASAGEAGCGAEPFQPQSSMPSLPAPWARYVPGERWPLPASMQSPDPDHNAKMRAIAAYRSQTGPVPTKDWLASFARRDEAFWPESWVRCGIAGRTHWVRARPAGRSSSAGFWWAARVVRPDEEPEVVLSRDEVPEGPPRAGVPSPAAPVFRILFDGRANQVVLARLSYEGGRSSGERSATRRLLREWPVPRSIFAGSHLVELAFDDRPEEGVSEVSVWIDDGLLGVAIDPAR